MKIAVAGMGYVGLSMATLLAQHHQVVVVDVVPEKVELLNKKEMIIKDEYIEKYFKEKPLDITGTLNAEQAYKGAEYIIVAAPTNYDAEMNSFDTSAVEDVIRSAIKHNDNATIIIKSTVPVGFTENIRERYNYSNIIFSIFRFCTC